MSWKQQLINEARQTAMSRSRAGQQAQTINTLLAGLRDRAADADRRGGMTAADLFGEQIGRQTDSARATANATKAALARAAMAGGGDTSGRTAAQMLGVDEALGRQLGGIEGQYGIEALRAGMAERGRGDRLLGQDIGVRFNLLRREDQLEQFNRMLALQRRQANQKALGDILGLAGTGVGFMIGGPAGATAGNMLTHNLTGNSVSNQYA